MDEVDKKIIALLQKEARIPLKSLGERVFLSSPAVATRIEKMEKDNIIEGYVTKINMEKLGYKLTAFINLKAESLYKDEVNTFLHNCPNVLECNCFEGDYTILVKVAFRSLEELDDFIEKLKLYGTVKANLVASTLIEPRGIDIMKIEEDFDDEI